MANEQRVRSDFEAGTVTNNPLLIGGTSLTSAELASLPAIGAAEHLAISLDPGGIAGAPEIVYVTAHTASSTTATIVRAQEGTTARQHALNTRWAHSTTALDWTLATPVGMLAPYGGAAAPAGWLLCDGTTKDRTTYAALYAVVGFQFSPTPGTDPGSNLFYVPNLKGRVIAGLDAAQTEFDVRGESGGFKTHTLAATEMPVHSHGVTVDANNFSTGNHNVDHTHYVNGNNFDTWWVSANHRHNFDHWHLAVTSAMHWNATQTHGHHDRAGIASEAVWEGASWASGTSVDVTGTGAGGTGLEDTNHRHNANHDHGTANGAAAHTHTANHGHTGSSATAGSGTAHNNLQPYLTMNYIIKF